MNNGPAGATGGAPGGGAGRKASGQSAPGVEVQDNGDGTKRVKQTESPRDHHPTAGQRAQNSTK